MNSLAIVEREAAASNVEVTEDELIVSLFDGRRISVPITWYPRLFHGTVEERSTYELMGRGTGIHWPLLDEDISVSGLLKGNPSFESERSLQNWLDDKAAKNSL
ncbi:conserved hypothetical protein [Chloroherpeton thalassium ATCC 35110]|uniref:DUF2442 domain-containing protein n=1 Tax=Chloroherpeton thalassium (strain ATCC 35110 / GB-78) TaxID=517418 RepID=B3QUF6_CHLT3|nr:DUF2442 domain-containing protein [Chloroherpeton thalassium]ACF14405.1 conserved hypothetical protein [Chloroherpeton thalassium ATCC 35110]